METRRVFCMLVLALGFAGWMPGPPHRLVGLPGDEAQGSGKPTAGAEFTAGVSLQAPTTPVECDRLDFFERTITTATDGARSVYAADLDGDGDIDVLSASFFDDKIAWYKNTDGLGTFGPQRVITTAAAGARSVFAADLDGDGDIDVLSASFGDDKIAWYENTDGQGTFGPQKIITTTADGAATVFAADLDGDGDTDVLAASFRDDEITWYENTDGLGTFGPPRVITDLLDGAITVFAADFDRDGDIDVLAAGVEQSIFTPRFLWFENTDGLGSFKSRGGSLGPVVAVWAVFAADLNGDGLPDALSASFLDDKIAWYENIPGFGPSRPQRLIDIAADGATSVFAADMDGDGDNDVLSASASDDTVAWYENTDGLGTFSPQQVITTSADAPNTVFAVDLDGDGDIDVLSASVVGSRITWYENEGDCNGNGINDGCDLADGTSPDCNGNGVPDECDLTELTSLDCDSNGIPDECDLDCNNSGRPDKCDVADGTSPDCDGNDNPDECDFDCNNTGQPGVCDIADGTSADCNNNGIPDECDIDCNNSGQPDECDVIEGTSPDCNANALPDECDVEVSFRRNDLMDPRSSAATVHAADLDGDGDFDVLAPVGFGSISWFENIDGAGAFAPQRIITTEVEPDVSVFASDLDGDGDADVLSGSWRQNEVAWYENTDGLGTFGPQRVITTAAEGVTSIFAVDLDGDGDIDVLSSSESDNKIAWYENTDGHGTFGSQTVITTETRLATVVFAADLDGDGDIDVLSASVGDAKIAWYENVDGHGAFGPQRIITAVARGAKGLFVADMDGDGDPDVLSISWIDDKVAWYENTDGRGAFGPQRIVTTSPDAPSALYAADLDRDGDMDVLTASPFDREITWYENTDGLGAFGPSQFVSATNYASTLIAVDVDQDGFIDVLAAGQPFAGLVWYENLLFSRDLNENGTPDECESPTYIDIRPGSCPNPLSLKSRGVVPVAVVGTDRFDVSLIDPASLQLSRLDGLGDPIAVLQGPRGVRAHIEDVAAPFDGATCECHDLGADGIDDLVAHFSAADLAALVGAGAKRVDARVPLKVSGLMIDGTFFQGTDCIRAVGRGAQLGLRRPGE